MSKTRKPHLSGAVLAFGVLTVFTVVPSVAEANPVYVRIVSDQDIERFWLWTGDPAGAIQTLISEDMTDENQCDVVGNEYDQTMVLDLAPTSGPPNYYFEYEQRYICAREAELVQTQSFTVGKDFSNTPKGNFYPGDLAFSDVTGPGIWSLARETQFIFETSSFPSSRWEQLYRGPDDQLYLFRNIQGPQLYPLSALLAQGFNLYDPAEFEIFPENPRLTSPTHAKGQPSCEQALTVQWETPASIRGVAGYSFTIVSQDDPYYDTGRSPDEAIDLGPLTTTYTTPPLEAGHTWEFNIGTVDLDGRGARFYESFWVEIASCSVVVTKPRSGDQLNVGHVGDVFWNPTVTYGGDDVGGGYDVTSIDLLKGSQFIKTLQSNLPNVGFNVFLVPEVDLGSDYRLRIVLGRNAIGNMFPGLPEKFIGYSGNFTIKPLATRISGAAYFYPESPTYRASFSMDATGPTLPTGWLKYYYSRTRLNFISTGISSVSNIGDTVNISGSGTVNGATGYTFTATVVNGTPDSFAITINKLDGSVFHSAGPMGVSSGGFTLSQF